MKDKINQAVNEGKTMTNNIEQIWPTPKPLPDITSRGNSDGFPFDVLPPALFQAAEEVARFSKVPLMAPAISGLGVLAVAIGKKAVIEERAGLEHNPTFFFVLVAGTGERKSPVFSYMVKPLDDWERLQERDYRQEVLAAKHHNDLKDNLIKAAKQSATKEGANLEAIAQQVADLENQKRPILVKPSLFTTDTTEEKLFQKMHARGETYAMMSAESRKFMESLMGSSRSGEGTGDNLYLSGFSGDKVTRDRVGSGDGGEELVMYKPCLNVTVMIQPDKYLALANHKELRSSGLIARLWPVWLPSLVGTRIETLDELGLEWDRLTPFYQQVTDFINAVQGLDEQGDVVKHKALLSEGAKLARLDMANRIETAMAEDGSLADVRDIASKSASQVCKLALVLHLANNPELISHTTSEISLETWQQAEALSGFFMGEAIRSQRCAEEGDHLRHAKRVLDWLRRNGLKQITAREISRSAPRPKLTKTELVDVLGVLTEPPYQWLKQTGQTQKGAAIYSVHPDLFSNNENK
ncbi:DUF3987 domain-containing protein [uncultured Methylophaga sp.]|uniref:DUF3987 domain-containing protein n=1 Tax=uncultured Methylophaga sp. TaxID=285271 RepID=UPI0030DCAD84|tara:strand:- start:25230 stop:26804 length:1575 start_codon:yes stop_codon:yes gene_type:complete